MTSFSRKLISESELNMFWYSFPSSIRFSFQFVSSVREQSVNKNTSIAKCISETGWITLHDYVRVFVFRRGRSRASANFGRNKSPRPVVLEVNRIDEERKETKAKRNKRKTDVLARTNGKFSCYSVILLDILTWGHRCT